MHIQHIEIGNFRKLHAVRIDFSDKTTVFVGANNSGKTSAMVALRSFLLDQTHFSIHDITLSHWEKIEQQAASWEKPSAVSDDDIFSGNQVLPFLDVWLSVSNSELHYVQKLLPTLDWEGGSIGVRLRYQPKDLEKLKQSYLNARETVKVVMGSDNNNPSPAPNEFSIWPRSLMDFLSRRLRETFEVRAYLLDPKKLSDPLNGLAQPQNLSEESEPIEGRPFEGLIKIDEINAQRGFGFSSSNSSRTNDLNDENERPGSNRLSSQLRSYYSKHLDPFDSPQPADLDALKALHSAQTEFGKQLTSHFSNALTELTQLGYPGVTDPKLTITPQIKAVDGLNHAAAVQYEVPVPEEQNHKPHLLPENSNGLGYQNLVSMVFALMSFRDQWMKVGQSTTTEDQSLAPLHLVLIEEPEAHLHAQVQQVFIRQAYQVLRKHNQLGESTDLQTQLVVSTHSSHVMHEVDFANLRYFRRQPADRCAGSVPISSVVNLSTVFGKPNETQKFVARYLKATHCDLFFADGVVLLEGAAERILIPHWVRELSQYEYLKSRYITYLEIGGSHAHKLKPLLEALGLCTLIITDIDVKEAKSEKKAIPERGKNLRTRNQTLKNWIPEEENFEKLLDKKGDDLVKNNPNGCGIRVVYQQPITVNFKTKSEEVLANTFEDALFYENIELFCGDGVLTGLAKKFSAAANESNNHCELKKKILESIEGGNKAEFSLDLLGLLSDKFKTPSYINQGLEWLCQRLQCREEKVAASSGGE